MAWYGNIQPCVSRVDFFFFNTLSVSFYIGHHIFTQALKLSQINSVSRRISEVFLDFCLFLFLIKRYQFLLIPFHVPPLEQLKAFFCIFFLFSMTMVNSDIEVHDIGLKPRSIL